MQYEGHVVLLFHFVSHNLIFADLYCTVKWSTQFFSMRICVHMLKWKWKYHMRSAGCFHFLFYHRQMHQEKSKSIEKKTTRKHVDSLPKHFYFSFNSTTLLWHSAKYIHRCSVIAWTLFDSFSAYTNVMQAC